ncbi:unnamed protein product [Hydatigera taeniaeformis]|uniref:MFS domain-containing protein n=1 Tax=Hydatigena taeniaeformis TaxID=6205 RepID=A0A0R3WTI2_HYDTA|nr:unnamed protein product [Hydatigera taeniaeformis]
MDKTGREQWVQSQSAFVATTMSFVSGIVGLFTIVPLGFISDRFGRKCGLLIAYTGFGIEAILNGKLISYLGGRYTPATIRLCCFAFSLKIVNVD